MILVVFFSVFLEFQVYFNCMVWLFIFVLIVFILIFVEVGGYSKVGEFIVLFVSFLLFLRQVVYFDFWVVFWNYYSFLFLQVDYFLLDVYFVMGIIIFCCVIINVSLI